MKRIVILILLLCPAAHAIDTTASGDYTAGATWVGGVPPANGETAVVKSGHTLNFDEDMSGWANGITLTIESGGAMTVEDDAGAYYLKFNAANITVNGDWTVGTSTSVPFTGTFTVDFNGSAHSIKGTGNIYFYDQEPTYTYIQLSAQEAAGQTELSVDTDVTADIWADGDSVLIGDNNGRDAELRTIAVGGIAAGAITVTAGLTNQKEAGAYIVLCNRNIRVIGSTTYAVNSANLDGYLAAYFNNAYGIYNARDITVGGVVFMTSTYGLDSCQRTTINAIICGANETYGIVSCYNITVNSPLVIGFTYGLASTRSSTVSGQISGCSYAVYLSTNIKFTTVASLSYNGVGGQENSACFYYCTMASNSTGLVRDVKPIIANNALTNTTDLNMVYDASCYNVNFGGATEFANYNSVYMAENNYTESFDHDQTTNAFKAWSKGGIVTSQTTSPPTGYTIWYEHACEYVAAGSYPCFRQYETTVLPGTAIEVTGKIRIADEENLSSDPPALQILDAFADPLIDATKSPLDEDEIPQPNGALEAGWQDVSVIWANTGDSPRQVIVRMYASVASVAANVDVDEVWAVATYKDQIAEILKRVKRLAPGGEID